MVAYIDDFRLMLWITLFSVPMLLFIATAQAVCGQEHRHTRRF